MKPKPKSNDSQDDAVTLDNLPKLSSSGGDRQSFMLVMEDAAAVD
jgi:hypothetical protein